LVSPTKDGCSQLILLISKKDISMRHSQTGLVGKHVATESIEFQNGTLFKELTLAFAEMKKMGKEEVAEGEAVHNVIGIIKHHTGLNVFINVADIPPSVDIPAVNKNNPLINSFIRNFLSSSDGLRMINEADGVARGSVSLKTGKVSGIFSEVKSTINLPVEIFTTKTHEPEEIAAITLHEIGHLFTYYEFMSRSVTTNQALAGLSKALDGSGSVQDRESVLITIKKAMKLTDLDEKELAKSNNNKVIEFVVISSIARQVESEIGTNIYDFSTWEYLADDYATRQGAGRHLVIALDKLYRGYWNISFRSLPVYIAMEALKLVLVALSPFFVMFMLMDGSGEPTYDRPGARFKRVRNQIVEALKNDKLSKDDVENLNADLVAIDKMLESIEDRRQWVAVLWESVIPSERKMRSQQRLQQELEAIATNELFVKAAQLKQMA